MLKKGKRFLAITKSLVLVGLFILGAAGAGYAGDEDDDSLIARWKFEEGKGEIAGDSSGNGNEGKIFGATWTEGISGSCLKFDGVDDYVEVLQSAGLEVGIGPFSVEVSFKTKEAKRQFLIHKYDGTGWSLEVNSGRVVARVRQSRKEPPAASVSSAPIFNDGEWHQAVLAWQYPQISLYVDGKLIGTEDNNVIQTLNNGSSLQIGALWSDAVHHTNILAPSREEIFKGEIDEISIYYAGTKFVDKTSELKLEDMVSATTTAAWGDYDNDGWVDLYDGTMWKNIEGKHFKKLDDGPRRRGTFADIDNDGYLDIFAADRPTNSAFYRNVEGTGKFTKEKIPELPMSQAMCMAWADLDGDSFVDLYIGGGNPGAQTDAIYMNQGGKGFTAKAFGGTLYTRGANACDYDEDNDMDVIASRYWFQPNQLWQNDGKGNLTDVGGAAGVHGAGHTISGAFADLDNDGHFDYFACNFNHHDSRRSEDAILYKNLGPEGDWRFEQRWVFADADWQESYASCALADYDNDGDIDIFITTVYGSDHPRLYRNDGVPMPGGNPQHWRFTHVTTEAGLADVGNDFNYQAAWADYDNDGDLDLVTGGRLYQNQGNANHWLRVRLQGNGRTVNRAAIGAQVRISVPKLGTLTRQVESGTGQGNQNDLTLHFGLGSHTDPVDLQIVWPDGSKQSVRSTLNRVINVIQN